MIHERQQEISKQSDGFLIGSFFGEEEEIVEDHIVALMEAVIDYIEQHLDEKLDLGTVAEAVHYSKYHLHRLFAKTTGMTLHDYVQRRQMTEAAKLLVFSDQPILETALICGYESQQAFSSAFKAMYKTAPAEYRDHCVFYPLQLRFTLMKNAERTAFTTDDIVLAEKEDIPAWMELMRLVIDGYPVMNEDEYRRAITASIEERRALVLQDGGRLTGAMTFSPDTGCIDFWGVHPQYRRQGVQKLFLDVLMEDCLPGRDISTTTYRAGDKADTGYRDALRQLGFAERELLIEFGHPTQRFVLPCRDTEDDRS